MFWEGEGSKVSDLVSQIFFAFAMKLAGLFLALLGSASALVVSPLAAQSSARAVSPAMACNGGKGGSGGMAPKLDKMRRGRFKALVNAVRPPLIP